MLEQIVLLCVGFFASFFSALAGGGAGLVQFPALIHLGLPFQLAMTTHKVAVVALGVGAGIRYLRSDLFDLKFFLYLLIGGLPSLIYGNVLSLDIPENLGKKTFGIIIILLSLYSVFKPNLGLYYAPKPINQKNIIIGFFWLSIVGFLNGILATGPGLFFTLMLILYWGFDYQRAVAYTMLVVGLFWNFSSAMTVAIQAPVQWSWVPMLVLGGLCGGWLGTHIGILKGNKLIKRSFELISFTMGLSLIFN